MKVLILGGTQFVGRHMAEEALRRGHEITLFHRGKTGVDLFRADARVEHILGDRAGDHAELAGGNWDAVIDCSAYETGAVDRACRVLKDQVGAYAFVSTISVYAPALDADEGSPLEKLPDGVASDVYDREHYGALKALCEDVVTSHFPNNSLNLRLGLQIGEYDHTDRFGDWIERIGRRSQVIVPGGDPMIWQQIDARDTARFTLQCLENQVYGTYNLTGEPALMTEFLDSIRQVVNPECEFVEKSPEWLKEHGVEPWGELTLWLRAEDRDRLPIISIGRAKAVGLEFRPLADTVRDAWDWLQTLDLDRTRRGGLGREKEDKLLQS